MTEVSSKYICKLISVYESDNSIYIVMELLTRSLYSQLKINGLPNLNSSKEIMIKLLLALGELHKKNIMHRDLKLENIMILQKDSVIEPIVIDLGLAEISTNPTFLYTKCGTPGYVAP
jgi:calcium-dependent protein kinase